MDLFWKKTKNNTKDQKNKKDQGKSPLPGMPKIPKKQQFWANLLSTLLIFLILVSLYSLIIDRKDKPEEIPISQLAQDIEGGLIASIIVRGEELELLYNDETEKKSKKEVNTALTDTLVNYGVSRETLVEVSIDIQNQTGFKFWLAALAPFLIRW